MRNFDIGDDCLEDGIGWYIARQCLGNCVGQLLFADLNLDLSPVIVNSHGENLPAVLLGFADIPARRRCSVLSAPSQGAYLTSGRSWTRHRQGPS